MCLILGTFRPQAFGAQTGSIHSFLVGYFLFGSDNKNWTGANYPFGVFRELIQVVTNRKMGTLRIDPSDPNRTVSLSIWYSLVATILRGHPLKVRP